MLKRKITIMLIMLVIFCLTVGFYFGYRVTMESIKAYAENEGVVLLEVYGQEWVYEE